MLKVPSPQAYAICLSGQDEVKLCLAGSLIILNSGSKKGAAARYPRSQAS